MNAEDWLSAYAEQLRTQPPTPAELDALLALAANAARTSERIAAPVACWMAAKAGVSPENALALAREARSVSLQGRIFATLYDTCMARSERTGLGDHRGALLSGTSGDVLEVGAGTGANLAYYPDGIALVLTEPEAPMANRLRRKLARSGRSGRVISASSEQLPFEDASFDCVVSTLVLCTVADPDRALDEIHRVLKPAGELLFIEHVRSSDPRVARWQDRLHGAWIRLGHGCNCNRRTLEAITAANFTITTLKREQVPKAPAIVRPLIVGSATAA